MTTYTHYQKGRKIEEHVSKFFRWHGFISMSSRGSHGLWDIVILPRPGLKTILPTFIQAGPKTKEELESMRKEASGYNNAIFFHLKKNDFHAPTIKLIESRDRQYITIESMIESFFGIHEVTPFFKAVRLQEKKEREERRKK